MAGGGGGEEATSLEYTATWVVAVVCTVIVAISFAAERLLHYTGKVLKIHLLSTFLMNQFYFSLLGVLVLISNVTNINL